MAGFVYTICHAGAAQARLKVVMRGGFLSRFRRRSGHEAALVPAAAAKQGLSESSPDEATEVARIVGDIARQGLPAAPRKVAVSLRLDADVLDWFRRQGSGYQTRINAVLRAYRDAAG